MKTLVMMTLALVVGMMSFTTASAATNDPLKIIIPAGSTGSYNARFEILRPQIEKVWGNDVELVYGKNCILTKKLIEAETGPVLTIWQVALNVIPECDLPVQKQDIVAVEINGLRFCTTNATGLTGKDLLSGRSYTVGVTSPYEEYVHWLSGLNDSEGTKLKAVPFASTGKARRGLIAGDVDFVLMSPSNSNKLMTSGGKCFFSTLANGEPKWNLPPLRSAVSYNKAVLPQGIFYPGFNMTDGQLNLLRNLYALVALGLNKDFNKFAGGKDINLYGVETMSIPQMNKIMSETYKAWKR